jgi:hypothetical protein
MAPTIRSRLARLERELSVRRNDAEEILSEASEDERREAERIFSEGQAFVDADGDHVLILNGKESRFPNLTAMDDLDQTLFRMLQKSAIPDRFFDLLNAHPSETGRVTADVTVEDVSLPAANETDAAVQDPIGRMRDVLSRAWTPEGS